jgi:histidinol dehydrogenase
MRILEGQVADAFVANVEDRGSRLGELEPVVRKIVDDVRRDRNAALLKHASQFDGLDAAQPLRVSESEMKQAWKHAPAPLQTALKQAARSGRSPTVESLWDR